MLSALKNDTGDYARLIKLNRPFPDVSGNALKQKARSLASSQQKVDGTFSFAGMAEVTRSMRSCWLRTSTARPASNISTAS
jgi:hypothetical protein